MQRLHIDDLVGHVTAHEAWDVVSIPAIAERDEIYEFPTPYGIRRIVRNDGDTLQPDLLSRDKLELLRRGMTEYNFAAQYQQNPDPPSGNVVKREWLKFMSSRKGRRSSSKWFKAGTPRIRIQNSPTTASVQPGA